MQTVERFKYLRALGISVWVKRGGLQKQKESINNLRLKEGRNINTFPLEKGNINTPPLKKGGRGDLTPLLAQPALDKIPLHPPLLKGENKTVDAKLASNSFQLILQPLTQDILIIAEAQDAQAPGLSAQEQQLLKNICFAVHRWQAIENPPALVGESSVFKWPPTSGLTLKAEETEQAIQGLLAAQKNRGFQKFLVLSSSLKSILSEESNTYFSYQLDELYRQPSLKRNLWTLLLVGLLPGCP